MFVNGWAVPSGSHHKYRGRYSGDAGVMMVGTYRKTCEAADALYASMLYEFPPTSLYPFERVVDDKDGENQPTRSRDTR